MNTVPLAVAANRNATYEWWRWQTFVITWLAYAGFYLTRKSFAVAKIEMGQPSSLGLSPSDMGWIDGAFLLAYALGQFFCGICGDRFGPRRVVLTGMLGSVAVAITMGLAAPEYLPAAVEAVFNIVAVPLGLSVVTLLLGLLFFGQGLCQSSGWAPLAKNLANFFSRRERGMVMGLWCTNYAVGGLVASAYAGYVGQRYGWRAAFIIPAVTLLGVWVLFLLLQRNRPEELGLPSIETYHGEPPETVAGPKLQATEVAEGSWRLIRQVLGNPMVLLLCGVYFCLKPARYAILFWGPKYISEKLGTGMADSGFLSGLYEAAGPLSVFAAGWVSDRIFGSRRMPVAIICLLLLSGLLVVLDKLPSNGWWLGSSLFLLGLLTFAPDSLISGTAAVDFGTRRGASTASGLINGSGSIGAIVGGTLPGFLQHHGGWPAVFMLLGISVLVAALLLLPKWNAVPAPPASTS